MRKDTKENRSGWRNRLVTTAAILVLAVLVVSVVLTAPVSAQTPTVQSQAVPQWQIDAGGKMEFDVASVKQDTADPSAQTVKSNIPLGPRDVFTPTGGLLSATNFPLFQYMIFAYKIPGNQYDAVMSQLPKWATANRYDIQARASGSPTKDQFRLMMQALLADRFKMAIHYEARQLPVFALVLDKPGKLGPQLQPHSEGSPCSAALPAIGPLPTVAGGFPLDCGAAYFLPNAPGRMRVGARDVTMEAIATSFIFSPDLSGVDRPVLDRTGLTEEYDFAIEWTPEVTGPQPSSSTFQPDATGPTFLEALKEQLGLKLESQTGPVDVLVIDHMEETSPN